MTGLTKVEEKKILSATDKISAGAEVMVEAPLHLIKCILMKHEKDVLEVMKELHERAEQAEARALAAEKDVLMLREELVEAWDAAVYWAGYAGDYVQKKLGMADDEAKLEAARKALAAVGAKHEPI